MEVLDSPNAVLGLLREQASLYDRLERLAVRQRSLVTAEDAGPLLALLGERQKLSEGLTGLARRLEPVRRSWSTYRAQLPQPQQVEADCLWDDVRQRLGRIIDNDEQDARILSMRKQSVAKALRATQSTRQAISAYHTPSGHAGRLDCVDEDS